MKRFFKALAWGMFGLVALAFLAVAWVVAINGKDEPLSDAARQALHYTAPTGQQLQGNGHLIIAGLDAPATGGDPVAEAMALGRQRLMREIERRRWAQAHGDATEGMPSSIDTRDAGGDGVFAAAQHCPAGEADCFAWWGRQRGDILRQVQANAHLLVRFAAVAEAPQFRDLFPFHLVVQFPPFGVLVRVHELQLAHAALLWMDRQPGQALAGVKQASAMRGRLGSGSRNLITSMVALAMQYREQRWLAEAVARSTRETPPAALAQIDELLDAHPPSLRGALDGEMQFSASLLHALRDAPTSDLVALPWDQEPAWWRVPFDRLSGLGFLPMQTVNLSIENLRRMQAMSDVPADQLDQTLAGLAPLWEADARKCAAPWRRNFVGRCMASMAMPAFPSYMRRIHDVEGHRRLVVLLRQARAQGVAVGGMPAWLAESSAGLRNPYTGQPMRWDAAAGELVFEGRETQSQNADGSSTYRVHMPAEHP